MSAVTSPVATAAPSRATTGLSDDAVPEADPSTTAGLLAERLQAWKHAVGYLEEYIGTIEKIHGRHAKEYEKALKVRIHDTPLGNIDHFEPPP
jgi:hypothetical protein